MTFSERNTEDTPNPKLQAPKKTQIMENPIFHSVTVMEFSAFGIF